MKKSILAVLTGLMVILFSVSAYAAMHFGVLKVITNQPGNSIFVDGNLSGRGMLLTEKTVVGNHLVQIKDDQQNVLFEEMVVVRKGTQTTVKANVAPKIKSAIVVAPIVVQPVPVEAPVVESKPSNRLVPGIAGTIGTWVITSPAGSSNSPEPIKTVGLYLKNVAENNTYVKGGIDYIVPLNGSSDNFGTIVALDFGGNTNLLDYSLGVNYLFPASYSGSSTLSGNVGGQAFIGTKLGALVVGMKYQYLSMTSGAPFSGAVTFSQMVLGVSADLW